MGRFPVSPFKPSNQSPLTPLIENVTIFVPCFGHRCRCTSRRITTDAVRTEPACAFFAGCPRNVARLERVLIGYARKDASVGYCQARPRRLWLWLRQAAPVQR
jgi:hypothetical protein